MNKDWDVLSMANDLYNEYIPYQKKFDLLGMAERGVLRIPAHMIDPKNRNVAAVTANIQVGVAFNKNLISADKTPASWEDYLKPEFKGKKFVADIRPTEIAALVPAWGLEKTLDYASKLAAQEPVWVRGATRATMSVFTGEYPMFIGGNYKSIRRAQQKDRVGVLQYKFLEPIPVRTSESLGVIATSGNPHAALLWIEFLATPEGQKIIDEFDPFGASTFTPGSMQGQEIKNRAVSLVDWEYYTKLNEYQDKIVAAYGFPKADLQR
jgi:ABC-type Fe3+ transport system substrate-binding protein